MLYMMLFCVWLLAFRVFSWMSGLVRAVLKVNRVTDAIIGRDAVLASCCTFLVFYFS